jgi:hypothetical protein
MSLDLVEIALDRLTDSEEFEKMATEVLYEQGHYDIRPMPGGNDFGQDAIEDKFFIENGRTRTVFQYSLQSYAKGKIEKTLKRLLGVGIEFSNFVYVTKRPISGEVQENLKRQVRKDYKVNLDFYEKGTFVLVLSKFKNQIFNRRFPNIDKQVEQLKSVKPILSEPQEKAIEISILKTAIALSFNKAANKARKDIFDNLLLAIFYFAETKFDSLETIVSFFKKNLDPNFDQADQIKASIDRLKKENLVSYQAGYYCITKDAVRKIEARNIILNQKVEVLLGKVLDQIAVLTTKVFSLDEQNRIKRNAEEVLVEIFKLHGLEISSQLFLEKIVSDKSEFIQKELLVSTAKKGVSPEVGEMLVTVIANILRHPTEEEAEIISNMVKAFLAVKIMNLDPNLKELKHSNLSQKYFFIDTDFLLNCVIKERPDQEYYLKILRSLSDLGCNIILPQSVFEETLNHAAIAHRSYHYFGPGLHSLAEEFVDFHVKNLFTQGYYYYYQRYKSSFDQYISNYYNPDYAEDYFLEIIEETLPKGVRIGNLKDLRVDYPQEKFDQLSEYYFDRIWESEKSKYRTESQVRKMAASDAELFLVCYYLNRQKMDQERVLGGKAYLLTKSYRYIKGAKTVGLEDIITAAPQTIASVLDLLGKAEFTNRDYLRLLNNPLMVYSVQECWTDVEFLIKLGLNLNGKSLTNLRWEFNSVLHDQIKGFIDSRDNHDSKIGMLTPSEETLQDYSEFVDKAEKMGYEVVPEIGGFISKIKNLGKENKNLKEENEKLKDDYQILRTEISKLSAKRQRYLDSITKKGKKGN